MPATNDDLYAALIAALAKLIDAEKRAKGMIHVGSANREAIALIQQTKAELAKR